MQITRKGYTRKSYIRNGKLVKSVYVKRGKIRSRTGLPKVPKRRRVLPKLKKGTLKGYSLKLSTNTRRKVIARMMKRKGGLVTLRHLVVLRTYNKHSKNYKKLDADVKYAQKLYRTKRSVRGGARNRRRLIRRS